MILFLINIIKASVKVTQTKASLIKTFYVGIALTGLVGFSQLSMASGSHHAEQTEHTEIKGPNGGKLLSDEDFSVEVTIFESGIPPEMRIFAYQNETEIVPEKVELTVTLDRLGGVQDIIQFTPERNYLVGDKEVIEPHSFDVTIKAQFQGKSYHWHYDNHEGRAEISDRLIKLSAIETENITPQTLEFTDTLFGVISVPQNKKFQLHAPYPGLVEKINVNVGDKVVKGQRLATLHNTQTLQNYYLESPTNGEISGVFSNTGDRADENAILEIIDLSEVWVDLSAFPENIERLSKGQNVIVYDLHHHERVKTKIDYIAPQMTGGHIARARAVMKNPDGHWRPGMHIKADIEIENRPVDLAVKVNAIQSFRDMPVVFAKFGNTFEVRMVQLGESDGEYVEVLGGIAPGTEYVTGNSFLLKAEVLKDGASHDH
ncbi:efflux RND transporter periplasmic adaptor subunit [Aliikangiella coralliicola]|uniref:HlyD family efflux transporter periplasmic adaptor subunit n=1 Tax=Aliikangiella coralliicola TaxID=2592383 RepID=A0A545UC52_9GAMM|nr:efflux RND transporter periplasmic adaptor subunit [Aliikangiella coralliicola]TQV87048.1 HlyD family efflux transporter periplasmic adaptor subunit [Aliikangiella coralliicola]